MRVARDLAAQRRRPDRRPLAGALQLAVPARRKGGLGHRRPACAAGNLHPVCPGRPVAAARGGALSGSGACAVGRLRLGRAWMMPQRRNERLRRGCFCRVGTAWTRLEGRESLRLDGTGPLAAPEPAAGGPPERLSQRWHGRGIAGAWGAEPHRAGRCSGGSAARIGAAGQAPQATCFWSAGPSATLAEGAERTATEPCGEVRGASGPPAQVKRFGGWDFGGGVGERTPTKVRVRCGHGRPVGSVRRDAAPTGLPRVVLPPEGVGIVRDRTPSRRVAVGGTVSALGLWEKRGAGPPLPSVRESPGRCGR